jgi:signal transduction histidine kinase
MVNVVYNDGFAKDYPGDHKDDGNVSSKVLHPEGNSPPVLVKADKTRIMQVISNLLTNAIKFTRGGKVAIIVDNNNNRTEGRKDLEKREGEVKQEEEEKTGGEIVVSFRDSGTGIDPEIIDKIFGKFVTKSDKGTGLGLFISKKIIEAHGGRIWAKNNTDSEGATIAFSLPIDH